MELINLHITSNQEITDLKHWRGSLLHYFYELFRSSYMELKIKVLNLIELNQKIVELDLPTRKEMYLGYTAFSFTLF